MTDKYEVIECHCMVRKGNNIYRLNTIIDLLNEQDARIKELEDKLNQTALFFLNYNMITMGKAVEISEMSYFDFLKYRKENGNPMELQL